MGQGTDGPSSCVGIDSKLVYHSDVQVRGQLGAKEVNHEDGAHHGDW